MMAGGSEAAVQARGQARTRRRPADQPRRLEGVVRDECRAHGHEPGFVAASRGRRSDSGFRRRRRGQSVGRAGSAPAARRGDRGGLPARRSRGWPASRAPTDVNGLREANGPYRIFTTDEAADYMRSGRRAAARAALRRGATGPWRGRTSSARCRGRGPASADRRRNMAGKPDPRRGVVDRGRRLHRHRRRAPAPGSRTRRRVGALAGQGRPRRR